MFPKMGVAPNHPFLKGFFHYKPTILGDPSFMETPIYMCMCVYIYIPKLQLEHHMICTPETLARSLGNKMKDISPWLVLHG